MSAPVDVLAVMARGVSLLRPGFAVPMAESEAGARDLGEAQAAVAELIAADREYDEARGANLAAQCTADSAREHKRFLVARERRAAALARIGGAA